MALTATTIKPFRLGIFSYLEGKQPTADVYADAVTLLQRADELGFDTGWVAQHHFHHHGGLPTPFVFFASVAARTRQIGFGTAVLTLAIEDPIRLAEEAAVFNLLHPDRLEIGFGTGFATDAVLETFGVTNRNRREVYDIAIDRIQRAFHGEVLNLADDRLYPEAPDLNGHLWEAPSTDERVAQVGARGNGLLLSRVAIGVNRPTDEVQRSLVDHYKAALPEGVAPRIALSRSVYPSSNPELAYKDLVAGIEAGRRAQPNGAPVMTLDEAFNHFSIHWGEPAKVAASLAEEPLIASGEITDLVCQLSPGTQTLAQQLDAIELLATEVAQALGWTPANAVHV